MIKQKTTLEYIVEGKVYQLIVDNDSPTMYIKEALIKFMDAINAFEEDAKKKAEALAAQQPPAPVEIPVDAPVMDIVEQPKVEDGSVV